MMIGTWKTKLFLLFVLTLSTALFSQSRLDFGQDLLRKGDYFRATTVFKEIAFFAQNQEEKDSALLLEGLSYLLADKANLANNALNQISEDRPALALLKALASLEMGLGLPESSLRNIAQKADRSGTLAALYLALAYIRMGQDEGASELVASLEQIQAEDPLVRTARNLITNLAASPEHSAFLAGTASAILPGSGQFFTGHYFDGIQAIGFLGFFGYATYASYMYESDRNNGYVMTGITGTITAAFYVSNILGAAKTAEFATQNGRQKLINPWERLLWARLTDYVLAQL
jgi:hypothetical protein